MKLSYNWLCDYVEPGLSPSALADRLTMSGLEVEGIEPIGPSLEGVVVGHVRETRAHPNADRLTLCAVDLGDGEPVQIVCGAPNVAAGQKVPVATVGTTLQLPSRKDPSVREPVTLAPVELRGEVSNGMICAEDELGLGDDHSGILVLDPDAPTGTRFEAYLRDQGREVSDAVLDIAITPNRPDAISHFGVARDVGALEDQPLCRPEVEVPESEGALPEQVTVEIEAPELCPRYVAMLVEGVTVQESPGWLKQRLLAVGLRPRNAVVDVTNYVMYECGQPLHAFDHDQLAGGTIVVRATAEESTFTTLDSQERTLPAGALMICDAERPVAIAGVMGGENSEVTDATTRVLIESAYFDPSSIRRTAKALRLQTDASYRFERGVDRDGQPWAAARAAALIAELTGGRVVPGLVDAHPLSVEQTVVDLRLARIEQILGVSVPQETVVQLLEAIGFEVETVNPLDEIVEHAMEGHGLDVPDARETVLRCVVPTFRPDVEREIDVIEEVARLYGYDRIPEPDRMPIPSVRPTAPAADRRRAELRRLLVGLGYREIYTNSMLRTETAERFNTPVLRGGREGAVVTTLEPASTEMEALRPSLLPNALDVLAHNWNHGQRALRFAEVGHVYRATTEPGTTVPGYDEHEALLLLHAGTERPPGWDQPPRETDFFDVKGNVDTLLETFGIDGLEATPVHEPTDLVAYRLDLQRGARLIGTMGRVAPAAAQAVGLDLPVYFAELDWSALMAAEATTAPNRYRPISRYPTVERDLAIVVDRAQPVGPLIEAVRQAGGSLLQTVEVFDVYEGERVERGRKSVAFALRFGADKTLRDKDVDKAVRKIEGALAHRFGAERRG